MDDDDVSWLENIGAIDFVNSKQCCWMVPYLLLRNTRSCLTSPMFSLAGRKWRLAKVKMMLHLWNEDLKPPYHTYNVSLSTEDSIGGNKWCPTGQICDDYGFSTPLFRESYPRNRGVIPTNITSSYIFMPSVAGYRGRIIIFCKVEKREDKTDVPCLVSNLKAHEVESSSESEEEEETKEMEVKGLERLAQNLKNLLKDGQNSDVILKAENREFRVHKGILGARSPVFASMFQLEMKEKTTGVVDIPDCTAESFEVFLLYLYTGAAETMSSENVSNLYYAADKYRVDDLKEECVQFMKDNMSVENVCDVVALSLRHGEKGLLKEATNFFREHIKEIIKTVKWQTYMQENSTHANELLVKALDG